MNAIDPEVAIFSTKWHGGYKFPRKVVLRQFQDNRCYSLITGNGLKPGETDYYFPVSTTDPNTELAEYEIDANAVFNDQGDVTVLVSTDGARYTVRGNSFDKTFSALDSDNAR